MHVIRIHLVDYKLFSLHFGWIFTDYLFVKILRTWIKFGNKIYPIFKWNVLQIKLVNM